MKKREVAGLMTEGVVWRQLLSFSVPFLIGNIFQQCYSIIDAIVVGRAIGSDAIAAIGASSPIIPLLQGIFMGITAGASILVSQSYGAQNTIKIRRSIHTSITISIISGIILSIIGVIVCKPFLMWLNTPDIIMNQATLYLRIYFIGTIPLMVNSTAIGILRAVGNSKTPLYYLVASCFINSIMDIILVVVFGMGIGGAAAATIISEVVAVVLTLRKINSQQCRIWRLRIYLEEMKFILRVGMPQGVQTALISISYIAGQYTLNNLGVSTVAGWNIADRVVDLLVMPIASFSAAVMVFAGQNVGSKTLSRVDDGLRSCLKMSCGYTAIAILIAWILSPVIMRLFTSDASVLNIAVYSIRALLLGYTLQAVVQSYEGVIRGTGHSAPVAGYAVICRSLFRVIFILVASMYMHSVWAIVLAYFASWLLNIVLLIRYYRSERWHKGI